MTDHTTMSKVSRIEVIATGSRRRWSPEEKQRIVAEALSVPRNVSATARRQGLCLFAKRLEKGRFIWPATIGDPVTITPAQLGYLLEGIDWRAPQRTFRPELAG